MVLHYFYNQFSSYIRTELHNEKPVRKLYTANCGDARVVLSRAYQAQRLTYDHKVRRTSVQLLTM